MSGRSDFISSGIILLSCFLAVQSCRKEEAVLPPVIRASVFPVSGNTTQTFTFDLIRSESRTSRGDKVFTRWDWDNDGTWDTPFTRLLVYEHRYHVPGTWKPRLEMSNLAGGTDTASFIIPVERGYSAPRPVLIVYPATGHIYTEFVLDASQTRDDEDSLDQLVIRWDFDGNGLWDTPFGDSNRYTRRFPETGLFQPRIQVRDPHGLISQVTTSFEVTLEDPGLLASFRTIPDSVVNHLPVMMDASASLDPDHPDKPLLYRWDWNNDRTWDTEWLDEARTEHTFTEEYFHFVRLEVKSYRGLVNDTVQKIRVYHRNQDPMASFSVSTLTGNIRTIFRFDCWSTRDAESSPSRMFYRWDFDGDGQFDTDFSGAVVTRHQFDSPGVFTTTLQVRDEHGGSNTAQKVVVVTNGTNPTGIYEDTRGVNYESYGTVLIGNQWWFTRNMTVIILGKVGGYSYRNDGALSLDYGHLYAPGVFGDVCPPGWRVPSREDWETLFSNFAENELFDALMPGGQSDFGAIMGGMGAGSGAAMPYSGLDTEGYYWSTTKPHGLEWRSIWTVTFDKAGQKILKGYMPEEDRYFSIRCMKDRE